MGGLVLLQICEYLVVFVAGALPGDQLADRRTGARDRLLVGFDFRARGFFAHSADAQPTFFSSGFILMILKSCSRPGSRCSGWPFSSVASDLWQRPSTPSAISTKAPNAATRRTLPWTTSPMWCVCEERLPDVGLKLLHAKRQAAFVRLDRQNDSLHAIALLQDFRRMLHALGPAQVADVDQAVDAVFDLDEGTEIGQVAHAAFDRHADRELLVQRIPRIGGQLAHPERDASFSRIHVEDHAFDLVANVDQLRRMLHPLRPCHFADVDQPFDALLEFDECSVVSNADDASANVSADGIAMLGVEPRIRRELLEPQRDALLIFVVLENLDLDLIADVDEIFGVGQASPRHVGDVQKAVETAQINERAVLGQVLDDSGQDRAFFQMLQSLRALLVSARLRAVPCARPRCCRASCSA